MIKLNLGCGNDYKEGYINIDLNREFCGNGVDRIEDIRCMNFEPNSVDEIVAEGCIEHLSYRDVMPTLIHWFSILKPQGTLIIETPNIDVVMKDFETKRSMVFGSHSFETLFGGQRNPTENHKALYNFDNLWVLLQVAGFTDIERADSTKNLESGTAWNVRLRARKLYEWSFPFCPKCKEGSK